MVVVAVGIVVELLLLERGGEGRRGNLRERERERRENRRDKIGRGKRIERREKRR